MIKQKTLHILYSGLGGTTDYVFNLIKADVEHKFEHVILFYGVEEVPEQQLKLANSLVNTVGFIHKKQGFDSSSFKQVFSYIQSQAPNQITLHVNSLIVTCAKYKASKLIFVEHQANHLKTKKEWLWSIIAQKKADYVITLTEAYQKELHHKLRFLYYPTKNKVIKTGLVLADYTSNQNVKSDVTKVGMVSRINHFRDHKTLIEGFNLINLPNIELHIAGDGVLLKELRALKYSNVIFHGNIPQKEIPHFLSGLTIYCQASKGETSSIALMQAQASGLPIIATNVKGINNVLTSTNCILVTPNSVSEYKNALKLLINDPEKRQILAKNSLVYATANLSHFSMFEGYKNILNS